MAFAPNALFVLEPKEGVRFQGMHGTIDEWKLHLCRFQPPDPICQSGESARNSLSLPHATMICAGKKFGSGGCEAWGRRRDNGTLFYFVHGKLCPLERTNEPSGREKGNTTLKMGLEKKKEKRQIRSWDGGKGWHNNNRKRKERKDRLIGALLQFPPPLFSWEIRTEPQENIPQKYTMGRH